MDEVCLGLDFLFVYLDDILGTSPSSEKHSHHLRTLFQRLLDYGLVVNPDKCELGRTTIDFLGDRVSVDDWQPLPDLVHTIKKFPQPTTDSPTGILGTVELLLVVCATMCLHTATTA